MSDNQGLPGGDDPDRDDDDPGSDGDPLGDLFRTLFGGATGPGLPGGRQPIGFTPNEWNIDPADLPELPAATGRTFAWSRAEWVEHTLPTWRGVVEPVALRVGDAMADAMASQAPQEVRPMLAQAEPMLRKMGGAFFGAQLGRALGTLAREVVGGGDIGLPLLPAGQTALLPTNVAAFGAGL